MSEFDSNNLPSSTEAKVEYHIKDPHALEKIEKVKNGVFGFFITRFRLTILILIGIVLLGTLAIFSIPRESDPEVKIPIAVVTTVFPGASPADVEDLVTDEIENKIEELDDLKLVTSRSVLGLSAITVEFDAKADLEKSIRALKDKVAEVAGLPDDATDPRVTEIRINDFPIVAFSLAGPLKESELKSLGEHLQDELEKVSGVSEIRLLGVRDREFSVLVNQGELERLNIPITLVVNAIAIANGDTPLGSITLDATNYNIRTVSKVDDIEQLKNVVVTIKGDQTILLKDVAEVRDQFVDRRNISRLSVEGTPSIDTISLQVLKKTGGNIINIVDTAKEKMDEFKADGTIPAEVEMVVSSDYSQFIRDDLKNLGTSGVQSVVLIFIVLFLALSIREALISLFAIPLTLLISILVLYLRGDTLNSLVLFSLVLSLGLLVDAFIIMLEGIFHNIRIGYKAFDAALLSIAHYRAPLFSGALTTIAAFVPMLLVSGILGEYLKVLPITISTALLSSLFVSLIIVPAVASVILKKQGVNQPQKESYLEKYLTNRLTKIYIAKIDSILRSRKKKWQFIGVNVLGFVIAMGLLISPIVAVKLFPEVDVDFSMIDIELPVGSDLESTNELTQQIESYLYNRTDIENFTTSVGSSSSFGFSGGTVSNEHVASINMTFVDESKRDKKSYQINEEIRKDLQNITEGKITVREISAGPPTGAPIEVRITGQDLDVLDQLRQRLITILENTPGVIDIESDKEVSPADLTFSLKRDALAEAGLTTLEVSGFLRTAIFGLTATEININSEDVDVVVKLSDNQTDSIEKIKNISIPNSRGQSVKLSRLADFSLEPALATINHRDFKRNLTVQANLEPGFTPASVVPEVEKQIRAQNIPEGYEYNFGGEVEDIEQSFSELWNAMIVAVLLILFILVLQFNSFKKPFIILLTLPLSLIGIVTGMFIFHLPFSFSVFLGIISLAGIAVNDAIVLLDKADRNISEHKMKPREAVVNAGATRLQPIMLTSVTTIAGIAPLAFADEFWLGLSIALIFGLMFTTILQLFVVPILYLKMEGRRVLRELATAK